MARPPIGFAHRGARADAPENTLAAFALARELGASGLESDVWLTADGVPVLDHDGVFDVRGARRGIAELARRELPDHVPTLAELYETCGTDFPLSLDLKDEVAAPATIAVARDAGALEQLWLCHWNWRVVASLRDRAPGAMLVDSTRWRHMRTPPEERAARMQRLGIDAINLRHDEWNPRRIEPFRARGRLVLGWDAQRESALRRAVALGLDGVFSDHVERMMCVIGGEEGPEDGD